MDSEEFGKKSKAELKKFAEASKNAFEKVGDNIQKFTDESVVKIERSQLEHKRDVKYEELGKKLSLMLISGAKVESAEQNDLSELLNIQKEIENFTAQINEKTEQLKK